MGILATYKAYKAYEPQYKKWDQNRHIDENKHAQLLKQGVSYDSQHASNERQKAKVAVDSILMLDNYAQSKASDVEAVFQTLQIELLAGLTVASGIPKMLPSFSKPLSRIKNKPLNSVANLIDKFSQKSFKVAKKSVSAVNLATVGAAIISAAVYVPMVKDFVLNQIGATRRAKFEGMNKDLSDVKDFAILTDSQEGLIDGLLKSKSSAVDIQKESKVKSAVRDSVNALNIAESLNCVNQLMKDKNSYSQNKQKYDSSLRAEEKLFGEKLLTEEISEAELQKDFFQKIIKDVDIKSHERLEKIEKIINVGYSSLFVGGFLEYLMSDKAIELLKVKNPILKKTIGFGIPLVSYLVLNKSLANIQNDAIKAVRYKNFKELLDNPENFAKFSDQQVQGTVINSDDSGASQKKNIFSFVSDISRDIKEYRKYQSTVLPNQMDYLKAKRQLEFSPKQLDDAKQLQRNTFMAINTVDDNNQHYSESIETLSEIALAPIEIGSTAAGAAIGKIISSKITSGKLKGIVPKFLTRGIKENLENLSSKIAKEKLDRRCMALGSILMFLPSAIAEIYTTAKQRQALRIAGMLSSEELSDYRKFVNYDDKSFKQQIDSSYIFKSHSLPSTFAVAFTKQD